MYKALLDMDGVIADFMTAICKAHGRPNPYYDPVTEEKARGTFDTEKIWGITPEEFWAPIQGYALDFWETIEKTPEADQIIRLVSREFGVDNVAILTAPSKDAGSVPGKRAWMDKNYPAFSKRMIFTSAKEFLAGGNRFLIDDRDKNIQGFEEAGGTGILVPRPWNRSWRLEKAVVKVIEEGLERKRYYGK